jgi:hypothetical protein
MRLRVPQYARRWWPLHREGIGRTEPAAPRAWSYPEAALQRRRTATQACACRRRIPRAAGAAGCAPGTVDPRRAGLRRARCESLRFAIQRCERLRRARSRGAYPTFGPLAASEFASEQSPGATAPRRGTLSAFRRARGRGVGDFCKTLFSVKVVSFVWSAYSSFCVCRFRHQWREEEAGRTSAPPSPSAADRRQASCPVPWHRQRSPP